MIIPWEWHSLISQGALTLRLCPHQLGENPSFLQSPNARVNLTNEGKAKIGSIFN